MNNDDFASTDSLFTADDFETDDLAQQTEPDLSKVASQAFAKDSYETYLKKKKPSFDENLASKKRELEKGPRDFHPISSAMNEQNYYQNLYVPSQEMPYNSPYLGMELVIPDFDPDNLPDHVKQEVKDAIREIYENECQDKDCAITEHKIDHMHCDGCGQPYQLEFKNYHDIANREPRCKTCGTSFDYGEEFDKTWKDLEQDVTYLRNQAIIHRKEQGIDDTEDDYQQIQEQDDNAGTWHNGTFYSDNGDVTYGPNYNENYTGNRYNDDPYDSDPYEDNDPYENNDPHHNNDFGSYYNDHLNGEQDLIGN